MSVSIFFFFIVAFLALFFFMDIFLNGRQAFTSSQKIKKIHKEA